MWETLLETDVPLFVHTVNGEAAQQKLIMQGIYGIYTDFGDAGSAE